MINSVCVYCGSSDDVSKAYFDLADALGKHIAQSNLRMVYGGGNVGLMGACARAAHGAGGDVLGIIPQFLLEHEKLFESVPHKIVDDMSTRKQLLYEESDAFVVLPGGIGTVEEVVEVLSWAKLNLHTKPIIFLDEDGYWAPILEMFDHLVDKKFAPPSMKALYSYTTSPSQAIARILSKNL